jgi:hypothetical protein
LSTRPRKTLKVNIPYRGSDGPLHLLVDSTGIKVEGEGEWNARKHGGTKRRVWRKIHIGIDEKSLEIRAAEFTTSDIGDAPMLPELLDQIPPDQEIASVTADGAFDTRKCHEAVAARGAAAIIPPRKNAKPWKPDTAGAVARNDALRASQALRTDHLATMEWVSPPKPRRDQDGAPRFLTACAVLWPVRRLEEHMTCLGRVWRVGFAGFTGGGLRRLSALGG